MNPPPSREPRPGDEPALPEDLAEVGRYRDLSQAHEHGLVILAMREPCWVMPAEEGEPYSLHAQAATAEEVSREIQAYEKEKSTAVPQPQPDHDSFRHPAGWGVGALWLLAISGGFVWQQYDPSLVERGASSSTGLIGQGEYWRPFTALFLHSDVPHLIGNMISGMIFGTLLTRIIGAWRAWALILACGTAGNAITSVVAWPEGFLSIGASTAVFAALGILCGLAFAAMLRAGAKLPWARTAAPVIAGIILLGWLGGGTMESNTDVLGHVFGFASGITAGTVTGFLAGRARRSGYPRLQ